MTASHQAPLNPLLKSPQRLSAKWLHFLLTLHCAKPPSDEPAIKVAYQVPSSLLGTTGATPCPQQEAEAKSQGKCWSPGTLCLAPGGTENRVEHGPAPSASSVGLQGPPGGLHRAAPEDHRVQGYFPGGRCEFWGAGMITSLLVQLYRKITVIDRKHR